MCFFVALQSVPTASEPFRQIIRYHTPLGASQEPGTTVLREAVALVANGGTSRVCEFRVARYSVVHASYKVVARNDASDAGVWSARRTYYRDAGGVLTDVGAQTDEWSDTTPASGFAMAAFPTFEVQPDDISICVEVAALVADATQWEVELTLRLVSAQPTVASFDVVGPVVLDGDLTISGANLFSYGIDRTEVIITGDGAKVLDESAIIGGGGAVDENGSTIVIPAGPLLVGVSVGTSYVRVRVNGQTIPSGAHVVAGP